MATRRLRAILRGAMLAASAVPATFAVAEVGCGNTAATDHAGDVDASAPADGAAVPPADASADTEIVDAGPPGVCASGPLGDGAPSFVAAGEWTDASICAASPVLPPNGYSCCAASYFIPLPCLPAEDVQYDGGAGADVDGASEGGARGARILDCNALCGHPIVSSCEPVFADDGGTGVRCQNAFCLGRRPTGYLNGRAALDDLASTWTHIHSLEAASITAFRTLRAELRAHGAPRSLLRAASRAARDERRHARITASLARRSGGAPRAQAIPPSPVRALEAIAIENAVEGCVRELYGAAVAKWQATHARDAQVRAAMAKVAEDELRHAALAFRVAAWVHGRLSPAARRRVDASRARALEELAIDVRGAQAAAARAIGLPTAAQAHILIRSLLRSPHATATSTRSRSAISSTNL